VLREEMQGRARSGERWDVLVIGGGATGLGAAVDAAARGYRTLLLEAFDFAKGTSSRSTKLIHGGVRYLARGEIALVREGLHERGLLLRNAPHVVHTVAFLVPAYRRWERTYYGLGLRVYDLLAGRLGLGRTESIPRDEALRRVPTLRADGLLGGVVYRDGQFDDARMAVELMRTFLDLGGVALNYTPVTRLIPEAGRLSGVEARDDVSGATFTASARAVINATGVYADDMRRLDDPQAAPMLRPSCGVHLVIDRSFLPGDHAVMIPHTDDGRVLFAIPWHDRTVIGTTDTPAEGTPIEPRARAEDVDYLLAHAARYLAKAPRARDVRSVFAGLRPLIGSGRRTTASLRRDHTLVVSPSGLVTITGGKWTAYRRMGADAVDKAAEVAGLPRRHCATEDLRLHGWLAEPDDGPLAAYGSDAEAVRTLLAERTELGELLHPDLPYRAGEVIWAARRELAVTVEDVLARRTRALFLDARASVAVAPRVASLLARELGRDEPWQAEQVRLYRELAEGYILADRMK
jgi:glycerol-3-phosphate dehydrogenase